MASHPQHQRRGAYGLLWLIMPRRKTGMGPEEMLQWMEASGSAKGDCLVWTRSALIGWQGRMMHPTRLAFELRHGKPQARHLVLSTCGTAGCFRDAHQRAGLSAERVKTGDPRRGSAHGRAKLTEEDVRSIREDSRECGPLALVYGVSSATISLVKRRVTWRHVT